MSAAPPDDEGKAVTYSLTAKQNYDKGLEELKDENYPEATRYFSFVKQKFPFSKYAVLAELALADTQFARGSYQEAIDAYKTFARLHPTHEKVEDGYVAFKIAECYVQEMPGDWFLVPPSYEKDQTAVRDAFRELSDFLDKYPDSKYVADVKKLRREVMAPADRARGLRGALLPGHAATPGRPSCASRRPCAATRSRGARPSCCWCWGRPTWRWATRCGRGRPSSGWSRSTARRCRPSGRSCTSSSSGSATATIPRTRARPPKDASGEWMNARAACCSAGASTTRATTTTRPSGAWCSCCAITTPSPTSTTCWA